MPSKKRPEGRPGFVYQLVNDDTGGVYVGSTQATVYERSTRHEGPLRAGKHPCKPLQRAWDFPYNETTLRFEMLELVEDLSLLRERERAWLDMMVSAGRLVYNVSNPKAGSPLPERRVIYTPFVSLRWECTYLRNPYPKRPR